MDDPQEDLLQRLLSGIGRGESVKQSDLHALWRELLPGQDLASLRGLKVFEEFFLLSIDPARPVELEMRAGGWTIRVGEGLLRSGIVGGLLAGLLSASGFPGLPAVVLPAIIPLLFDLEKVRLNAGESELLAELTVKQDLSQLPSTAEELYQALPSSLRDELSLLDFREYLERFYLAGYADRVDDLVVLRGPGKGRLRITFL